MGRNKPLFRREAFSENEMETQVCSPQANCPCLPINDLVDSVESNNNCDYTENNMYYSRCGQEDRSYVRYLYFTKERFNIGN